MKGLRRILAKKGPVMYLDHPAIAPIRALLTDPEGRELGEWVAAGAKPRFLEKCEKMGFTIPPEVYAAGTDE